MDATASIRVLSWLDYPYVRVSLLLELLVRPSELDILWVVVVG